MRINVIGWLKGQKSSFWGRGYRGGVLVVGAMAFLISWIASSYAAGFVGFMLGWIPSIIVGTIAGFLWPVLATGALGLTVYVYGPSLTYGMMNSLTQSREVQAPVVPAAPLTTPSHGQVGAFSQACAQTNRFRKYGRNMPQSIRDAIAIPESLASDELNWLRAMKAEFDQLDAFVAACEVRDSMPDEPLLADLCKAAPPSAEIEALMQNEETKRPAARLELLRRVCERRNPVERSNELVSLCSDMATPWAKALIVPDPSRTLPEPPADPTELAAAQARAISTARMRLLLDRLRVVCGFPTAVPTQ